MNQWLFLAFASGFAAAVIILLADLVAKRSPSHRTLVSGIIAIAGYALIGYSIIRIADELPEGGQVVVLVASSSLATTLVISRLSIYVSTVALVLCILTAIYTVAYMSKSGNAAVFYALTLFLSLSIVGITI
jgi:formate hydrogenlyase subunit 3/multisubunit Na+/H+ antiporter MnhD subunit